MNSSKETNQFRVIAVVEICQPCGSLDWIAGSIEQNLEEGEKLVSCSVELIEEPEQIMDKDVVKALTYEQILEHILQMTPEQRKMTATYFDWIEDEYYPIYQVLPAEDNQVLDPNHPVFVTN